MSNHDAPTSLIEEWSVTLFPTDSSPPAVIGLGVFDMESCYSTIPNDCDKAETNLYWATSYIYVLMLFIALFLNLFVIFLYARGNREFKKMMFYWLSFQLLAANVVYCIGQLISRDSLVLFSKSSQFDRTYLTGIYNRLHAASKFISNFYTQILPLGIIALALHRFAIFMLKGFRISEGHFITAVLVILWLIIIPMTIVLTSFDCLYHFITHKDEISNTVTGSFNFTCGSSESQTVFESLIQTIFEAEQLVIPCLDLLIYFIIIVHLIVTKGLHLSSKASYLLLIPSFSLFIVVEGSSVMGTFILTTKMEMDSALVAKRIINIVDMIAASLVPIIVFVTNKEVRQVILPGRKRTVSPNHQFIAPSHNMGSTTRMHTRQKSEALSTVTCHQQQFHHTA